MLSVHCRVQQLYSYNQATTNIGSKTQGPLHTMPGTITPAADFSAEKDCQELRNAMKGLGTNEAKIINILGNRSREQRLQIAIKFKVLNMLYTGCTIGSVTF